MKEENSNKPKSNLEKAKELLNNKKLGINNAKKSEKFDNFSNNAKGNTKGVKKYMKGSTNGS